MLTNGAHLGLVKSVLTAAPMHTLFAIDMLKWPRVVIGKQRRGINWKGHYTASNSVAAMSGMYDIHWNLVVWGQSTCRDELVMRMG